MFRHHHWLDEKAEYEIAKRQTSGLIGLVIVLLLLIGGLYLVQQLRMTSMIEDCLMAGHRNCDALVIRPH